MIKTSKNYYGTGGRLTRWENATEKTLEAVGFSTAILRKSSEKTVGYISSTENTKYITSRCVECRTENSMRAVKIDYVERR